TSFVRRICHSARNTKAIQSTATDIARRVMARASPTWRKPDHALEQRSHRRRSISLGTSHISNILSPCAFAPNAHMSRRFRLTVQFRAARREGRCVSAFDALSGERGARPASALCLSPQRRRKDRSWLYRRLTRLSPGLGANQIRQRFIPMIVRREAQRLKYLPAL